MRNSFKINQIVKVWNFIGNYWAYCIIIDMSDSNLYTVYSITHNEISMCEPWYLIEITDVDRHFIKTRGIEAEFKKLIAQTRET